MEFRKKCTHVLRLTVGWFLTALGGISGVSSAVCAFVVLFGGMGIDSFVERLIVFATTFVAAIGFFTILWFGIRLKNSSLVENADFDQLLNAWAVLNYYSGVLETQDTENIRTYRDYIHHTLLTRYGDFEEKSLQPAKLEGTGIYVESAALLQWLKYNPMTWQYVLCGAMPLAEKEPVISLYEDGVKTREYRLQTENDEDFTGKYFLFSIRMGMQGDPSVPVVQIDGFISDTPEERNITLQDIGYRMEGHFLACGGENTKVRQEMNRGQDLPMKALKYPGYITPSNIRMVGICPDCGKSFGFHAYSLYMGQCDVAYSDDGLECCSISSQEIEKDSWTHQTDGKTFRYYNSFCCPHCGTPYIDYQKFPENKKFGVSGCVHLGRELYYDTPRKLKQESDTAKDQKIADE